MALYRNISGIPKKLGWLYGGPEEDMRRGDGGAHGPMYPVGDGFYPVDYNPEGAGMQDFPVYPDPIQPIYPPIETVLDVEEPNVVKVTTSPQPGVDYSGVAILVGLVAVMVTGGGKGWAPWLLAGGCGALYLTMKKRKEQPVGIEPVTTQ